MSITKFVNQQADEHGGRLFWPGWNELPLRGRNVPLLNQAELDERVEMVHDFDENQFDLTEPEQHAKYVDIMDKISNGWYMLIYIDRWRDDATGKRYARVEWTRRYSQVKQTEQAPSFFR